MSTIEKAAARLASRSGDRTGDRAAPRAPDARTGDHAGTSIAAASARGAASEQGPKRQRDTHRAEVHGLPVTLCEIDLEALRARGYLTPKAGRTQLGQEMRRIKRPLLLHCQKARALEPTAPDTNPANLIMITSALPGEGKTFTSINLAMSMAAELDRRVLLVDADVARGDVARVLGLEPTRGLSDLLRDYSYMREDGVLATNVEGLGILPAGEPVDDVDELYASALMRELVVALAEADPARVVIFDAPPLLATTEAAVLARNMGQIVVVVEANRTPQKAVADALALLDGCENVSLVLNKTTGGQSEGYGYGYGYGSESQD